MKQPSSLLQKLDPLLKEGQPLTFRKGQVLIYEGHHPYGIFILQSGKVSFYHDGGSCRQEHLQKTPLGKVLGLDFFLKDEISCCTCIVEEDCQVLFISKTQLMPYLESDS